MNVSLQKTWTWSSVLYYDGEAMINNYVASLDFCTVSADRNEHNTAYERIKYWVDGVLHSAVLIAHDSDKIASFQATGQRVIVLPEEPVDQLIGMMLWAKFTAIVEGRFEISSIKICSDVGDQVFYCHHHDENLGHFASAGWWSDPGPRWCEPARRRSTKVINLSRMPEWSDLDLTWQPLDSSANNVLFADFPKNEN